MEESKYETTLFLYGASTQAEVVSIIRAECIDEDIANLESIVSEWREPSTHFLELVKTETGIAETIDSKPIDESHKAKLDAIASDYLFKQSFSLHSIEFRLVEVAKLVGAQRLVNLDYVRQLKATVPKNPSTEDLIEFCLAPRQKQPQPKVAQSAQNAFSYSSMSSDFRFLGGFRKPLSEDDVRAALGGGLPVASIVLLVGYGSSTCNVFSVGSRMILNNGFHRMFTLGNMGVKYAPVVVQKISNPELELPPQIAGLPTDYLMKHPRPVLMKDFFDSKLVRTIRRKLKMTNVQLAWNAQKTNVPI